MTNSYLRLLESVGFGRRVELDAGKHLTKTAPLVES